MKILFQEKGQTLIEVLAVLSIAVTVIGAMTISVINSLSIAQASKNKTLATQYAQQGLEQMRRLKISNYSGFTSLSGTYCFDKACGTTSSDVASCLVLKGPGGCGKNFDAFTREILIEPQSSFCIAPTPTFTPGSYTALSTGGTTDATKVTVTLSWRGSKCIGDTLCEKTQFISCIGKDSTIIAP